MNQLSTILLFGPREGADGTLIFLVNIALIFAIFYFILIRPQRKERQRHQEMVDSLKKGDEVVTTGGVIGKVVQAQPDRLTIRTAGDTKLEVERQKVAQRLGDEAGGQGSGGSAAQAGSQHSGQS